MAFIFIIVRMYRVKKVEEINEFIAINLKETNDKSKKKDNKVAQDIKTAIEDKLDKAKTLREERLITVVIVNAIIPLTLLGLLSNFVPWLQIIIPLDNSDVCWLYY